MHAAFPLILKLTSICWLSISVGLATAAHCHSCSVSFTVFIKFSNSFSCFFNIYLIKYFWTSGAGTFDAIIKMIRYEGLATFYKGMGTKIVQSVFAAALLFMVKEKLIRLFTILVERSKNLVLSKNKLLHKF